MYVYFLLAFAVLCVVFCCCFDEMVAVNIQGGNKDDVECLWCSNHGRFGISEEVRE